MQGSHPERLHPHYTPPGAALSHSNLQQSQAPTLQTHAQQQWQQSAQQPLVRSAEGSGLQQGLAGPSPSLCLQPQQSEQQPLVGPAEARELQHCPAGPSPSSHLQDPALRSNASNLHQHSAPHKVPAHSPYGAAAPSGYSYGQHPQQLQQQQQQQQGEQQAGATSGVANDQRKSAAQWGQGSMVDQNAEHGDQWMEMWAQQLPSFDDPPAASQHNATSGHHGGHFHLEGVTYLLSHPTIYQLQEKGGGGDCFAESQTLLFDASHMCWFELVARMTFITCKAYNRSCSLRAEQGLLSSPCMRGE